MNSSAQQSVIELLCHLHRTAPSCSRQQHCTKSAPKWCHKIRGKSVVMFIQYASHFVQRAVETNSLRCNSRHGVQRWTRQFSGLTRHNFLVFFEAARFHGTWGAGNAQTFASKGSFTAMACCAVKHASSPAIVAIFLLNVKRNI